MLSYIPSKDNAHSGKTLLFIFFVVGISAIGAYLVNNYPKVIQKNVAVPDVIAVQESPELINTDNAANVAAPEVEILKQDPVFEPVVIKKDEVVAPAPSERNKNPQTRLEEAKAYAKPEILTGKYIDISLQFQNMVIFEDGKALDAYQVSSGKKGLNTPIGKFKVENNSPKAWSKSYGLWMPNWMAFLPSGEMGIHELPIWPGGYQEGANHLGTPVSHGCVRLGVGAAKRVYDWAEIGTPIIIHL